MKSRYKITRTSDGKETNLDKRFNIFEFEEIEAALGVVATAKKSGDLLCGCCAGDKAIMTKLHKAGLIELIGNNIYALNI